MDSLEDFSIAQEAFNKAVPISLHIHHCQFFSDLLNVMVANVLISNAFKFNRRQVSTCKLLFSDDVTIFCEANPLFAGHLRSFSRISQISQGFK